MDQSYHLFHTLDSQCAPDPLRGGPKIRTEIQYVPEVWDTNELVPLVDYRRMMIHVE